MSLAATAAARGSRGARVASLGTPRAFARPLVGGARVFARDRSLPRSPSAPPRRGAFRVSRRSSRFVAATDDGAEPKPTPVASSVYADPELYELAFGFRDFDSEAAFLARMCRTHAGRAMRSVLELGAGPAWHSVSCVTTQGPCVAVALDNTPAMLKRASQRALERGCEESVAVVAGDMTRLDARALKQTAQTLVPTRGDVSDTLTDDRSNDDSPFAGFDVVTVLLGTAAHLTAPEDAEACLRGAAECLAPGGIVVLELEHPYDLFDGQLMDAHGDAWDREVENGGGLKVLVEWGREGDPFDVETQIVERTVGINVVDENGRPPANGAFPPVEEVVRCRVFTAPEIALLGKLAGLTVAATFGDMDADVPLTHEDANNMVIVLRRADDDETLRP
jgi:SAM-dependent methyltransferase